MAGARSDEDLGQRLAPAQDVRLHLAQGDPELLGDILVGHVLEMVEHQRDSLVVGQLLQRPLDRKSTRLNFSHT